MDKNHHVKKMIAPIIVTIIILSYYIGIAVFLMAVPGVPVIARGLLIVVPLILSAVMFGVLISRIREIKGGEEDDLSQY
ncbi:MAG: hypothetical protein HFI48_08665 [Lachnospiraceae bacterium]|mgnify:FL=1|nr:hypothetical protein [Lachnospiraceae bacterium]